MFNERRRHTASVEGLVKDVDYDFAKDGRVEFFECPFSRNSKGYRIRPGEDDGYAFATVESLGFFTCIECGDERTRVVPLEHHEQLPWAKSMMADWKERDGRHGAMVARDCPGRDQEKRCQIFNMARIPAGRRGALCSADIRTMQPRGEQGPAIEKVRERLDASQGPIEEWPGGVLLTGSNGTGKTFIMVGLARTYTLDLARRVRWVDCAQLLLDIRKSYGDNAKAASESDIIDSIVKAPVLILDDLVREPRPSAFTEKVFAAIICRRYVRAAEQTWVTTNRTRGELRHCIGNAAASRLFEMCATVELDGEDMRTSDVPEGW